MNKRSIVMSFAGLVGFFLAGAILSQVLAFQIGRTSSPLPPQSQSPVPAASSGNPGKWEYRILNGGVGQRGRFTGLEIEMNNLSEQGFEVVSFQLDTSMPLPGSSMASTTSQGMVVLMRRPKP